MHPVRECSHAFVNISLNSFSCSHSYCFHWRMKNRIRVESAFCVMESGVFVNEWHCRLDKYNSLFQAKLFAILNALDYIESHKNTWNFFSDSLFSLQAIHIFRTKDFLDLANKSKLIHLHGLAYLADVSSHTSVIGNERTYVFVKEGAFLEETKTQLPLSKSSIKNVLKSKILPFWQC